MSYMKKDKKQLTPRSELLVLLLKTGHWIGQLQSLGSLSRAMYPEYSAHHAKQNFNRLIQRLQQNGLITYTYKEANRIIKLTKHGELEALFQRSIRVERSNKPNTQWTIVTFDVPEAARPIRDRLRRLLKQYSFKGLQASVYISPIPISPEGYEYLKRTKLLDYIRIFSTDANRYTTDLTAWYSTKTKNLRP